MLLSKVKQHSEQTPDAKPELPRRLMLQRTLLWLQRDQ